MDNKKAQLRKELLALRDCAPDKSLDISLLENLAQFRDAKTVFCYVSSGSEVGTYELIEKLFPLKKVLVPYCTDRDGNMIASEIKSLDELKEGMFGIAEPIKPKEFPKNKIDFVIVPGISFDSEFYRLGYGKGYYDRFLCDISPFKLGVCKKELFAESLPHGEYDIKMDKVIVL